MGRVTLVLNSHMFCSEPEICIYQGSGCPATADATENDATHPEMQSGLSGFRACVSFAFHCFLLDATSEQTVPERNRTSFGSRSSGTLAFGNFNLFVCAVV